MSTPGSQQPIILLGASGCGKSSFINAAIGEQVAPVGMGIEPTTTQITLYPVPKGRLDHAGLQCTLVDTQGFSAHQRHRWKGKTDFAILAEVEALLKEQFPDAEARIIYLHSNHASEVDWTDEERTTAVFTRLAGGQTFCNLTVITTSAHGDPTSEPDTGLLKYLRDRGVQPLCVDNFEGAGTHLECGDVRTPRDLVEDVASLILARNAAEYDSSDESSNADPLDYQDEDDYNDSPEEPIEEQPPLGDTLQPPDHGRSFPSMVLNIFGGIFNDVQGNQTNNYPCSESPSNNKRAPSGPVPESTGSESLCQVLGDEPCPDYLVIMKGISMCVVCIVTSVVVGRKVILAP